MGEGNMGDGDGGAESDRSEWEVRCYRYWNQFAKLTPPFRLFHESVVALLDREKGWVCIYRDVSRDLLMVL